MGLIQMADRRKKSHALLFCVNGRKTSVELFPASEWPNQPGGENLYRVRINRRWHCPCGKYSFLTLAAAADLAADLLAGEDASQEEPASLNTSAGRAGQNPAAPENPTGGPCPPKIPPGRAGQSPAAPYLPWKAEVRVYLEDQPGVFSGSVHAPPHQERDGRWHVWVWVYGRGPLKLPCDDVSLVRVR
ncbi:MAG: hypothetical protein LBJ82_00680 [Deltaproteobacteria bacterium]|jgi:hypothetical protein|nr:hypothetical protein [Deltaproteobacteria bacterium]